MLASWKKSSDKPRQHVKKQRYHFVVSRVRWDWINSLWAVNSFFHFLFLLPRKDILSYGLALSGWVPLVSEYSRSIPMATVRWVWRKESKLGSQAKKRKFTRGKEEVDWPVRRASVLPFRQGLSDTPSVKNSLKGWSGHQWENRILFGQFGQSHGALWFYSLWDHHYEPFLPWAPI